MPLFPPPWSHYVRLLSVTEPNARRHYEAEVLRGGWSARQLDRQISTLAYQRGQTAIPTEGVSEASVGLQIKDSFVLEFLGLKDEYSESELVPKRATVSLTCWAGIGTSNLVSKWLSKWSQEHPETP